MTAIELEHLSKQYTLGTIGSGTLYRDLNVWWASIRGRANPYQKVGQINDRTLKADGDYVWALRDINLKIEEGDVVGIVGGNGAGKSTLLKILSRVTTPTTGRITTYGRIASLLEVGTGFHQEMTGRENIFMNGAIMGMTRAEITHKLDEIVDFAGVAKYIDTPVKRYSSGMTVRLGFAVAAFLEPEILVVDEVLAVGDAEFQKKAIGKMKDVSHAEGRTVLFVSHNMAAVRNLCNTGILLENGCIKYNGEIGDVIDYYMSSFHSQKTDLRVVVNDQMRDMNRSLLATIEMAEFVNSDSVFASDEEITIRIHVKSKKDFDKLRVNIGIMDFQDAPLGTYSSDAFFSIKNDETKILEYTLCPTNLALGTYYIAFSVGQGNSQEGETNFDVVHHVLSFEIDKMSKVTNSYFVKWDKSWGSICFHAKMKEI